VDVAEKRCIVLPMTSDETPQKLAGRILAWYDAMGVDAALEKTPVDWLSRGDRAPGAAFALRDQQTRQSSPATPERAPASRSAPATAPAPPGPRPARQFPGKAPADGETDARDAAAGARALADLEAMLRRFEGCGLKATAKNLCFYRGAERAPLMIIGEAPGRDEDLEGKPFVGRAGMLLDKMLAAIGLQEKDVHITNIVYWRPPGNRTPTPQEALPAGRLNVGRSLARVVLALRRGGKAPV
jgi:DNA polymerase